MNTLYNRYVVGLMIAMLALSGGLAWAGSLEPPASAVDVFGNPVSTTTGQLQPIDDGDIRFVRSLQGWVLDNRTGLEWEQSPEDGQNFNHATAILHCAGLTLGGQSDWRLPERDELASLVDLDNPGGNPDLPPGHPFSNVQSNNYWSATFRANSSSLAWRVSFLNGFVGTVTVSANNFAWCVR